MLENLFDNLETSGAESYLRRRKKLVQRIKSAQANTVNKARMSNPHFDAQVDLIVSFAQGGAGAATAANFPCMIFGQNDFKGKYVKNLGNIPIIDNNFVYAGSFAAPDAGLFALTGNLNPGGAVNGDLVHAFLRPVDGHWVVIVVHCNQVSYASFLEATQDEEFAIQLIKYNVPNPAVLGQLNLDIKYLYQTTFGKATTDSSNPQSFKSETNLIQNLISMPMNSWVVDKFGCLSTYVSPVAPASFSWSIFIDKKV